MGSQQAGVKPRPFYLRHRKRMWAGTKGQEAELEH